MNFFYKITTLFLIFLFIGNNSNSANSEQDFNVWLNSYKKFAMP